MDDGFDSQSWQDRCERYFTSISDTDKDRDQEKHARNDLENSREKREAGQVDDNDKLWKDLSEVKRQFSENRISRNLRKVFGVLDIHGAKCASKASGTFGFIFWSAVVFIALLAFVILLYFAIADISLNTSVYKTSYISADSKRSDNISFTVCNLNTIKRSKLTNSAEYNELKESLFGTNVRVTQADGKTSKDVINSNGKLKDIIQSQYQESISEFITHVENDIVVKEMMAYSGQSLSARLSKYGRPELLRQVVQPPLIAFEKLGQTIDDTLVECWIGNAQCQERVISAVTDPIHGNCIKISTQMDAEPIELILDVQLVEYIHQLTPTVGFILSLDDSTEDQWMTIAPGFHSAMSLQKVTEIQRLESKCNPSSIPKQECETRCLKQHVLEICSCSLYGDDSGIELCKKEELSDYVCIKALKILQMEGRLPCQCMKPCSMKTLDARLIMTEWPSEEYMSHVGELRFTNNSLEHIRANFVKLTVKPAPAVYEVVEEHHTYKLLDVLVTVGGLSALVVGISVVTVLELIYMAVQGVVRLIRAAISRSDDVASPRRLSESEITSITWAMYRQRRRWEELNKKNDKFANNTGVNALEGNAYSRIQRKSSHATADREAERDIMNVNKQPVGNNVSPVRLNYSRRYDGRQPMYVPRNRDSYSKDSAQHNGPASNKYIYRENNADFKVNVIHPQRPIDYMYDNRNVNVYSANGPYHNGVFNEMPRNERPADNVMFYDGAAAYFNPSHITSPVYL